MPARSILRPITIAAVGLALFLNTGCASDKAIISKADDFDKGIRPAEIQEQEINAYFQQIGDRIVAAAKEADHAKYGPRSHFSETDDWMYKGIQFHLVNSKTLNAFTTGGEHVYIYNELFQLCKTEDELAAVMSHEFGHIYCRHVHKGTNRQYGAIAAAVGLGAAGYVAGGKEHGTEYAGYGAAAGMLAGNFANLTFTRSDEAQADETGFHFYVLAGWDPNRFGDFFQSMIDKGYDKGSAYLSDHPKLSDRLEEARKRVQTLPDLPPDVAQHRRPSIATPDKLHRYQQLAMQAGRRTPDDTTLAKSQKVLAAVPRSCLTPTIQPDQTQAQQELAQEADKRTEK